MKGNISLKSFIEEVKKELRESINEEDPFFVMRDVELEISFALDTEAQAGAKLFVLDVTGSTKTTQIHKVKLTLSPFVEEIEVEEKVETRQPNIKSRIAEIKALERSRAPVRPVQPVIVAPAPVAPRRIRNRPLRRTQPVCRGGESELTCIAIVPNKNDKKI